MSKQTTLKQQLQEANRAVNFTRHIEGHFYNKLNQVIVCKACKPERNIDQIVKNANCEPVTIIIKKWLKQIRQDALDFQQRNPNELAKLYREGYNRAFTILLADLES